MDSSSTPLQVPQPVSHMAKLIAKNAHLRTAEQLKEDITKALAAAWRCGIIEGMKNAVTQLEEEANNVPT